MVLTERTACSRKLSPLPHRKMERSSQFKNQNRSGMGRPSSSSRKLPSLPNTIQLRENLLDLDLITLPLMNMAC